MSVDTKTKKSGGMKVGHLLPISDSLIASVLGGAATPWRERSRTIPARGVAAAGKPRSNGRSKEPDAVILEARRLHEQEGMSYAQVAIHLQAHGHSVGKDRVASICNYTTRAQLIPAANAQPYIERKTNE